MKYPAYDDEGKIICQLCGKSFQLLTPTHLKKSHEGITVKKYQEMFPEAPTCSDKYRISSKYKGFDSFKNDDRKFKKETYKLEGDIKREKIVYEDFPDPSIPKAKLEILKFLKRIYPTIENNFMIEKFHPDGRMEYQAITDIGDPVSKTDFEFPNVIWHNEQRRFDLQRNIRLKNDGWRVITIESTAPTVDDVKPNLDIVLEM